MKGHKLTLLMAGAFIVGSLVVAVGKMAGQSSAGEALTRLQILWPSLMSLPERDRAFLAGLSLTCRLHTKPIERSQIVACLREAAVDPNAILPSDEIKSEATDRLDRLLSLSEHSNELR